MSDLGETLEKWPEGPSQIPVVLVDESDRDIGIADKQHVHRVGLLHRAVSVFAFDARGDLVLQRRSAFKYHCANLWSNTCCGHPLPSETSVAAAERRMWEELGLSGSLTKLTTYRYRCALPNDMVENELVSVFAMRITDRPMLNTAEVSATMSKSLEIIKAQCLSDPSQFSPWFCLYMRDLWGQLQEFASAG